MAPRDDRGYALVAAVMAMGAFGYIAFETLATDRGAIQTLAARMEQARLTAAADAGLALAIHGLAIEDRAERWSIDGRPRRVAFEGTDLTIVVEDERAKAPISDLSDQQARALFTGAGGGDRVDALVEEYRQWVSQADDAPPGAPPPDRPIRHGAFESVAELSGLKDMDPILLGRIAPAVTVFFDDNGVFAARNARPLAAAVMSADDEENPESLDNEARIADQRPSEEIAPDENLAGRALSVRVTARAPDGALRRRMAVITLTGDPAHPDYVRFVE